VSASETTPDDRHDDRADPTAEQEGIPDRVRLVHNQRHDPCDKRTDP
jgi:hypothetical protein